MSMSIPTARWLAPASFIYNLLAQTYGLLSTPNMLDIHNAHISFFSPAPFLIAPFFFTHQIIQLAFLYRLLRLNPHHPSERPQLDSMCHYVPFLALGNVCIGTWTFFWNAEQLILADACVLINTLAQTYFVAFEQAALQSRLASSVLTHLAAKTYLGLSILDILHNTSIAFFTNEQPGLLVKVLTAFGFVLVASMSDWILGAGLVYALVAFSVGQAGYGEQGWSVLLGVYAVVVAAVIVVKNYARPPYTSKPDDYVIAAQEDGGDQA
ncbi:Hypothetical protein R9X50_00205700 [Acrodontium crateriforme]|uniref:Uncharacterized protein n=1 Tax=Acrodontium crateriforme TaxID=150365 RepID=A0AAQ3M048_9PEZI|nr:Hypothetical protein R9X50_00205700 [Acrodontium crateriforme]